MQIQIDLSVVRKHQQEVTHQVCINVKRDEEALTILCINQLGRYGDLVNPGLAIIDGQPGKTGRAGFGTVHYLIVLIADICC